MEFKPLNEDELAIMIGDVPQPIKDRVEVILTETLERLKEHYPMITRPVVVYDLRGRTAGWAIGSKTIRLNSDLLLTETEDMLRQTLPHEVAHIVQHQIYPRSKAHGYEWRRIMHYLGLPADRCHQYETVAVRKRARPYAYYCSCSEPHMVTETLHRRMQTGKVYQCRRCGQRLRKEQ